MSKIFYDKFINSNELDEIIRYTSERSEEREELWRLVDEVIHHRIIGCIFDHLPKNHHQEFMLKLTNKPHDEEIIIFLGESANKDMEKILSIEMDSIVKEILDDIYSPEK